MAERPVRDILDEWRAAERALDNAVDDEERAELEARIAELREEHERAIEERQIEAQELGHLAGRESEPAGA